jgi:hypothetical protein
MPLHRSQILLDEDQRDRLEELARDSGQSMSHVVREALAEYLARLGQDDEARRSLRALDQLAELRQAIWGEHGSVDLSLLDDVRDERERDLGR